ncbi:precorrin-8X methylmutase [Sulfurisphaera javensis]|uniref:Precorrin-8X methylmutase n=1 Tax=Sulfurisphaera javensis TaxID=2049879 RepID=A0AAT9GNI5_9CREN
MPDKAVIIITHGSRRNTFVEDMINVARYLEEKLEVPVFLSHNEYTEPNWRNIVTDLLNQGINKIIFALAFLGRGNHVARDIMGSFNVTEFQTWTKSTYNGKEIEVYFTKPLADSELVKLALFYRIFKAFSYGTFNYVEDPEEIEEKTMNYIRDKVSEKLPNLSYAEREVIARGVYASGNLDLIDKIYISPDAINVGLESLKVSLPILTDVKMVMAGIRWNKVENYLDQAGELAKKLGITRTAASIRIGLKSPKIVVIGNSPTALAEVIKINKEGVEVPLVIATPPGFTNAIEAKEELIKSGIPSIVLRGTYGGSSIAVSIINELIRMVSKNGW